MHLLMLCIICPLIFGRGDFQVPDNEYIYEYLCNLYAENTYEIQFTDDDIDLIALVTMAEAEGESEYGKRLVIDTILNRIDSEDFPDSVSDVVYQKHQFSSVWNGRIKRCYVNEEICELVKEELENRTNDDVIFFSAGGYSYYGEPLFKEGNHYFSKF